MQIHDLTHSSFKETLHMTILVAYVSRPEGRAALDKAIEISKERQEPLLIVNAGPGGQQEDASLVPAYEVEQIEEQIAAQGIQGEFKQFVRGKNAVDEINDLVETRDISILIIGLRKRNALGKLIMGSVAQDILMTVPCPVLCVKAEGA
ncbi:MAG: universal stress protein [Polaromonas sp.]|nr:universal stress protein [Polaromonas sp.]